MKKLILIATLAGCAPGSMTTEEGCPIGMTDIGIARQQACVAAYREEMARLRGDPVVRCTPVGNGMSCVGG